MESTASTETVEASEPIETTEASQPEAVQEEQTQSNVYVPRETKFEVNGHQYQINEVQLKQLYGFDPNDKLTDREFKSMVSAYKAQKTADVRSQKASEQERLVNELAQMIQSNPWELLKRAGYDPRELAETYLAQQIEEELLPDRKSVV